MRYINGRIVLFSPKESIFVKNYTQVYEFDLKTNIWQEWSELAGKLPSLYKNYDIDVVPY